jgi:hypothetical protein
MNVDSAANFGGSEALWLRGLPCPGPSRCWPWVGRGARKEWGGEVGAFT